MKLPLAQALARGWRRQSGEATIPAEVVESLRGGLPTVAPFAGEPTPSRLVHALRLCGLGVFESVEVHLNPRGASRARLFDVSVRDVPCAVLKIFATLEELLLDIAALDLLSRSDNPLRPVAVHGAAAMVDGRGLLLMERAPGVLLYDALDGLATATPLAEADTRRLFAAAGRSLAMMHDTTASGAPASEGYRRSVLNHMQRLLLLAREGGLDARTSEQVRMHFEREEPVLFGLSLTGTFVIGDVHPGNVTVRPSAPGEPSVCTVFDVATLYHSVGANGEGLGFAADDAIWFEETILWYARNHDLDPSVGARVAAAFREGYQETSQLAREPDSARAEQFFRFRSALTDVRWAPTDARALEALQELMRPG